MSKSKRIKSIHVGEPPSGYLGSHSVAPWWLITLVFLFLPFTVFAANSGNTTGWGWAEKFGWLSFSGEGASVDYGVEVSSDQITGHAWSEKTGWISFNCLNRLSCGSVPYAVVNDGNGNLSGYAWSEKGGWINFEGAGAVNYQAVVSQDGKFHGYVWSEKMGWINTNDVGAYYEPETDYATARIYYSVGQNTDNHETGAGTVSVSGLSATFSVAQTAVNMGVGDVIDYDSDNKLCYIFAKVSQETWLCQSAQGGAPTAATGVTVNAVHHAFASLSLAETGATGASYLNTIDLVTGNYQLNFPCYYDTGPDTSAVTIDGYTTGSANYIRVYTPYDTDSEVNQSQRHQGKWDEGRYRLEVSGSSGPIIVASSFVRIDGLQINFSPTGNNTGGILANGATGSDIKISNNIIVKDPGANTGISGVHLGWFATGSRTAEVWNNIIYGFSTTGISYGVLMRSSWTAYIYNNTVVNNYVGIGSESASSGLYAKNNISYENTDNYGASGGTFDGTSTNNLSGPTQSDAPGSNPQNAKTVNFIDENNSDFHLSPNDTSAIGAGTDLSDDSYLPFDTDIDGDTRSRWDIGADEKAGDNVIKGGTRLKGGVRLK